jgi:hypothetical protein
MDIKLNKAIPQKLSQFPSAYLVDFPRQTFVLNILLLHISPILIITTSSSLFQSATMDEDDKMKLGNPRNAATRSFEITFLTHLQVELPTSSYWRKKYENETMVAFATSATKVYMVLQSVDDEERIPMIMECFNYLCDFVNRNTVHKPSGCPLDDDDLRSLVYNELVEFNTVSQHDKNNDEVEFDERRTLFECLLDKAAEASILSGRSI